MKKEDITSKELRQCICLKTGKFYFEDVTEEEIMQIQEMDFRRIKFNGELTDVELEHLKLFPKLASLAISNFTISEEDLRVISELKNLKRIQFNSCEFSKDAKQKLPQEFEEFILMGCENMESFTFPKSKIVIVKGGDVYFNKIDLDSAKALYLQNTVVKNATDIENYGELEVVNLNGSKIYTANGTEISKIKVSNRTEFSKDEELDESLEMDF